MDLTGTYRITSSGSVIGEYQNMITTNGLLAINQYLAGLIPSWAGSLGIGTLYNNITASSTVALDYELKRYPITLKSYRTVSSSVNQIALKATIDPDAVFQAYELGVFPMVVHDATYPDHYPITDFSEQLSGSSLWTIAGVAATTTSSSVRVGLYTIALPAGSTTSNSVSINTTTYTEADYANLLMYTPASITSGSFTVRLGDDSSVQNVWTSSIVFSAPSAGYYSVAADFGTKPTFSDYAVTCSVTYAGTGTIQLDHLQFATGDTKTTDFKLVSRTGQSTPLFTKTYGQPMEIEYYIQVT
jgi:hypothetical protein